MARSFLDSRGACLCRLVGPDGSGFDFWRSTTGGRVCTYAPARLMNPPREKTNGVACGKRVRNGVREEWRLLEEISLKRP